MPEVRLIDANAALRDLCGSQCGCTLSECGLDEPCEKARCIIRQPTIEPEVRHGEWHECWYTDTVCASICTNCGKAATQARVIVGQELAKNVRYPLCPNCGAKMKEDKDAGTETD